MTNTLVTTAQKIKTHILYSILFSPESREIYEIVRKNIIDPDRS